MTVTARQARFAILAVLAASMLSTGCSSGSGGATPAPTGLQYHPNPAVYTVGMQITPNNPTCGGGAPTGYAVTPALPAGLSMSPTTGVISGTPTAVAHTAVYTVTASNPAGNAPASLTITVNAEIVKPTNLVYTPSAVTYTVGTAIAPLQPPTYAGSAATFSSVPTLPAGLGFDAHGAVTGTPTTPSGPTSYLVTATNPAGSTTANLQITVSTSTLAPTDLQYPDTTLSYPVGQAIASPQAPTYGGGKATSWSSTPALPAGLSLAPASGAIIGTPTAVTPPASYVIKATNSAGSAPATLNIAVTPATPTISFFPSSLVLAQSNAAVAYLSTVTMANVPAGVSYTVTFTWQSPLANSPSSCVFPIPAGGQPCVVNVNHPSTTDPLGGYSFTATATDANGQTITSASLPVYIGGVTPASRTITMVNQCPFPVFAGLHGGGLGAPPCPSGMTAASGQCWFDNPVPTNGYRLAAAQAGQPFAQTQFVIPAAPPTTSATAQTWSGNAMARYGCDPTTGNCKLGSCNAAGQTGDPLACAVGVGFGTPQTLAEFTLLTIGLDSYDVSAENGIVIPTSMKVTGQSPDPSSPWFNGEAGAVQQHGNLPGSSWTFSPSSTDTVLSASYYNLVDGSSVGATPCTSSASCATGQVCGYAADSITAVQGEGPTYQLTCGPRIAYLSPSAVWKGNSTGSNTAPFDFASVAQPTTAGGNTNLYPLSLFFDCPGPGSPPPFLYSGYSTNPVSPSAQTCGCSNWEGIAVQQNTCQSTNTAWTTSVLPKIQWIKKGCPTCYSFVYDDESSSYTALVPALTPTSPGAASTANAANATNYTITFCPNGISVPPAP